MTKKKVNAKLVRLGIEYISDYWHTKEPISIDDAHIFDRLKLYIFHQERQTLYSSTLDTSLFLKPACSYDLIIKLVIRQTPGIRYACP